MNELSALDLSSLKDLYEKEMEQLNQSLLGGATWAEVEDRRKQLREIALIIQSKQRSTNPAETSRNKQN